MSKSKLYIGIIITVIIATALGAYFFVSKGIQTKSNITTETLPTPSSLATKTPPLPLATKTPDEIKVIANVKDSNIEIKNMAFTPSETTIKVNDQVFWVNNDTVAHKIKGDNWGSININPGEKFVQNFEKAGTYSYTCEIHPEMKGKVIVE